jgi:hypothetical protein
MAREHRAWLDVVKELRARGVGNINAGEKDEDLHDAIVKWGEELVQLRMMDPDGENAIKALGQRRKKYPGRYEGVERPSLVDQPRTRIDMRKDG